MNSLIEVLSNLLDFSLFFFLINKKKNTSKVYEHSFLYASVFFALFETIKLLPLPTYVSILLILSLSIFYSHSIQRLAWEDALFWGDCYIVLVLIADEFTYFIIHIINPEKIEQVTAAGPIRYQSMVIYALVMLLGTYILSKCPSTLLHLPFHVLILIYATLNMGFTLFYLLMDMVISLDSMDFVSVILKNKIYLLDTIMLFFFLLLISGILIVSKVYTENHQLLLEKSHINYEQRLQKTYQNTRKYIAQWKHDYKNQLLLLSSLADKGDLSLLQKQIHDLTEPLLLAESITTSGDPILDTIISAKSMEAADCGVHIKWSLFFTDQSPLTSSELVSLVGNALDNAIEACSSLDSSISPVITFTVKPFRENILFCIDNPSNGVYHFDERGELLSNKFEADHGYGLPRIQRIVEKHQGYVHISPEADHFALQILIPFDSSKSKRNLKDSSK